MTPVVAWDCAKREDTATATSNSATLSTTGRRRSRPRNTCLMGVGLRWQLSRAQKIGIGFAACATARGPLHSTPHSCPGGRAMPPCRTVVVIALATAAACARPAPERGASLVTFTATEYAFQGPDTLAAGLTTLRLVNHGKELHHPSIFKLGEGKTLVDFQAAMAAVMSGKAPPPALITYAGGPNAIGPGGRGP